MSQRKAYAVLEEDENTGGIVFASHSIVALREGASRYGDGDIHGWRANRAQWADKFAETEVVPNSALIANGWNFECCHCGARVNEDWLYDNGKTIEGVIGSQDSMSFCCQECCDLEAARQERLKAARIAGIELLTGILLRRFPDVKIVRTHAYADETRGFTKMKQGRVWFEFPGMKIAPASLDFDEQKWGAIGPTWPEFHCCAGDKEAFEAYAEWTWNLRATEAQPS